MKSRLKRNLCDIGHRGGATVGGESDNHRSKTALRNEMDIEDGLSISIDAGPCYQIAAVVDGLLCGLKIVSRLEENCKRLWGDEFVRAGVGCGLA